jgi:hypothetical protein
MACGIVDIMIVETNKSNTGTANAMTEQIHLKILTGKMARPL